MDENEVREEGEGSEMETREDCGEEAGTKQSNISGCSVFVIAQINVLVLSINQGKLLHASRDNEVHSARSPPSALDLQCVLAD